MMAEYPLKVAQAYARTYKLAHKKMKPPMTRLGLTLKDVALACMKEMIASNKLVLTRKRRGGAVEEFRFVDFIPRILKATDPWDLITVVYGCPAPMLENNQLLRDLDGAILVQMAALVRYELVAKDAYATTYDLCPEALQAAGERFVTALWTAGWKNPVGLKVTAKEVKSNKRVARRALFTK